MVLINLYLLEDFRILVLLVKLIPNYGNILTITILLGNFHGHIMEIILGAWILVQFRIRE